MIYRRLDAQGDMTFGHNMADFLENSPETVAQAIDTRLRLFQGEWFLDVTVGTPYQTQILGARKLDLAGPAIRDRILGTQGVKDIQNFETSFNANTREFSVTCTVNTIYGQALYRGIM